jgi:hypothetical protein
MMRLSREKMIRRSRENAHSDGSSTLDRDRNSSGSLSASEIAARASLRALFEWAQNSLLRREYEDNKFAEEPNDGNGWSMRFVTNLRHGLY